MGIIFFGAKTYFSLKTGVHEPAQVDLGAEIYPTSDN
jgi:hypothetical protein